jgi:hypothetical protein
MTVTVLRIAIGVPGGGHDGGLCCVDADPCDLYLGLVTVTYLGVGDGNCDVFTPSRAQCSDAVATSVLPFPVTENDNCLSS